MIWFVAAAVALLVVGVVIARRRRARIPAPVARACEDFAAQVDHLDAVVDGPAEDLVRAYADAHRARVAALTSIAFAASTHSVPASVQSFRSVDERFRAVAEKALHRPDAPDLEAVEQEQRSAGPLGMWLDAQRLGQPDTEAILRALEAASDEGESD